MAFEIKPKTIQVPRVWPSALTPPSEVAMIKDLYAHLFGLRYSVEAWQAGLLLYQTAKGPVPSISREVASRWRFIACNECVLELYHLRARLEKIQSVQLRKCPSIRPWVNTSQLRAARKQLDDHFPGIESLRHAIAHKGENEAHPEVHAPDGMFALSGFCETDVFSVTYQSHIHRLPITENSLERVTEVVVAFCKGFDSVAEKLEAEGHIE